MPTTEYVIKKWEPLVEHMPESDQAVAAHCMENEARYLRDINDEVRSTSYGDLLKFIFPIIRMVCGEVSLLDRVAFTGDEFGQHILAMVKSGLKLCTDDRPQEHGTYEKLVDNPQLAAFADRLTKSYLALQG